MGRLTDLRHYDTDKMGSDYLVIYEEYFKPLVDREIKLLELGVLKGGSVLMWRDYFKKGAIVGLDINPVQIEDKTGRIHIYEGRQEDTCLLDRIAAEQAPEGFDVIIDDCSHIGELTRISFWHLFENHLKPGGIYAIEDFGTGYRDDCPDGRHYGQAVPTVPDDMGVPDRATGRRPRMTAVFVWLSRMPIVGLLLRKTYRRACRVSMRLRGYIFRSEIPKSQIQKSQIPSHMYGMVGFVKELVDACCLNSWVELEWGNGPRRHSKVARLQFFCNIAVVVKSQP